MFNWDSEKDEIISNRMWDETVKRCVQNQLPTVIHGTAGDGVFARLKNLYPDVQTIFLPSALQSDLCGISFTECGKIINVPPRWYSGFKEKCKSEPDKIHVLVFDDGGFTTQEIREISVNIALNRMIEEKDGGKTWELPNNSTVVILSKNDMISIGDNDTRFIHISPDGSVMYKNSTDVLNSNINNEQHKDGKSI